MKEMHSKVLKRIWFFLIGACIICSAFLNFGHKIYEIQLGAIGNDRIHVSLKNESKYYGGLGIELEDVVNEYEHSSYLGYSIKGYTAETAQTRANITVVGYSGQLANYYNLGLKNGRYLYDSGDDQTVIVSKQIAEKFFMTEDVVGRTIDIGQSTFRIVGIFHRGDGLVSGNEKMVFVSAKALSDLAGEENVLVDNLEISSDNVYPNEIKNVLSNWGMNSADFQVWSYGIRDKLMKQYGKLILFIVGLTIIIYLLMGFEKYFFDRIRGILVHYNESGYFTEFIKGNGKECIEVIGKLAIAMAVIYGLWIVIAFDFYKPPYIEFGNGIKEMIASRHHYLGFNEVSGLLPQTKLRIVVEQWSFVIFMINIGLLLSLKIEYYIYQKRVMDESSKSVERGGNEYEVEENRV